MEVGVGTVARALPGDKNEELLKRVGPTIYTSEAALENAELDYSIRGPSDYVVSGPLLGRVLDTTGKGRVFKAGDDAEIWGKSHFGTRFRERIRAAEKGGRWAILVSK
jgi:hypothetical protein